VFSPAKVDIQHTKVQAYLRGEPIWPTTMELDLTQSCSRVCPGCPYGSARTAGLTLHLPFLDRLFGSLGGQTTGLVLSGGECTIVPHFAETLALATGIDWLYFHPYCVDWDQKRPVQDDQSGVLQVLEALRKAAPAGANIQVPYERYDARPLRFRKLHGSHFLIQVGADGVNYAGPEGKYEEDAALLDLNAYLQDDWLWYPSRLGRLEEIAGIGRPPNGPANLKSTCSASRTPPSSSNSAAARAHSGPERPQPEANQAKARLCRAFATGVRGCARSAEPLLEHQACASDSLRAATTFSASRPSSSCR
jgi:hypothetical protein